MFLGLLKCPVRIMTVVCCVLLSANVFAQRPQGLAQANVKVLVQEADGSPISALATVILTTMTGQNLQQATTHGGYVEFSGLVGGRYNLEVVAPGYEPAVEELDVGGIASSIVTIALKRASNGHQPTPAAGPPILAPRAMKELGKAMEALRANKPAEARGHLDAAYRLAPGNPEVNYLFGVYSAEMNDWANAKAYWEKVLKLYPKHLDALLSLGVALLRENRPAEAAPYFNRAVEAEPTSWRAHALLADAYLRQGSVDECVIQAERALELGHGQATTVQPLLARALAKRGDKERAIHFLQTYLQDHPADASAKQQLENLQVPLLVQPASETPAATLEVTPVTPPALAIAPLPLSSNWLPPDVDEKMPPVEPGAVCALDEVMKNVGKRIQELVANVDRFTATESITHESIDKWGLASPPETFKFDYLVSIQEIDPGLLNVEEFRPRAYSSARFPDGMETHGLPALVLIFHPYNAEHFEMTCEGLARWNGGLTWQVHFRQRTDKPNTTRVYKLGENGPSYPVALKGRAWIGVDSYQIVRLETDLVAPLPEIHLLADHAAVEYGPVNFRTREIAMWLPQTAELYYDWRGHRSHRRHSFTNYLLFSVENKQRISEPKAEDASPTGHSGDVTTPRSVNK